MSLGKCPSSTLLNLLYLSVLFSSLLHQINYTQKRPGLSVARMAMGGWAGGYSKN